MSASYVVCALGAVLVISGFQPVIFIDASTIALRNNTPECRQKLVRDSGLFVPAEAGGVYVFSTESYNWTDARNFCKDLCLDLVFIEYPLEVDIINRETQRKYKASADLWTAGTNTFSETGQFLWATDATVISDLWLPGQPSTVNNTREASCVTLRNGGLGNDPCSESRKALCKML